MLLNEMEVFYYVAELKSFSKTAEKLNVSKSFVSKSINKLETNLKVRLLTRSTRKLTLTEAGANFYRHCSNVVQEAKQGYSSIKQLQGKPTGTLKISAPPALGTNLLAPLLSRFVKKYPDINLDIELEHRLVDLITENYDLVFRSAKLNDSNLIAQRIFTIKNVFCATPAYLKQHGNPKTLQELERHYFARYSYTKNKRFRSNFSSNHLDLIKKMVLNDACMAILPEFMIRNELKNNQLKRCLIQYPLAETPLYAIYSEREFMPLKLKVFLDMLRTEFHMLNEKK